MELRHLRYFVAVAEEVHFGRAAARLHIAQPALSQQIRRLEQLVGASLFDRTTRSVSLTTEGMALLPEARLAIMHADRGQLAVQRSLAGESGTLRVGFVSSAGLTLATQITGALGALVPSIVIELTERTTGLQLADLREGRLDVGVVRDVPEATDLTVLPLVDELLWAALHRSHPLAERAEVRLEELAHEPFVMFQRNQVPRLFDHISGLCWSAGFRPRVVQEALQFATLLGLVSGGVGVTIVPDPLRSLNLPNVRYVRLDHDQATSRVSLALRDDDHSPSTLAGRSVQLLLDHFDAAEL